MDKNSDSQMFSICLWRNFAGAMDMLGDSIRLCPDELWTREKKFFYLSYHTVIFLDYYLSVPVRDFAPDLPYSLVDPEHMPEGAIDDVIPDRHYRREEVLAYLAKIKQKARTLILNTPGDLVGKVWIDESDIRLHLGCPRLVSKYSILEILFYNLRHVQHHVGQLNIILRQQIDRAPEWVSHAE